MFEPAMCCPTGVCGANVDPVLVQFHADVPWLSERGVKVVRHTLGYDAAAFASNSDVVTEMNAGMDRLPITKVDGRIATTGMYPTRARLMQRLGIPSPTTNQPPVNIATCGCKPGEC
ncbi:Arsenical resistance operon trans-acting repressor ArsD [Burkholderiales bacterium]|nr:Arsenical resistance operon trans-acting repressor ArsD [Burkholderiales bacterium]